MGHRKLFPSFAYYNRYKRVIIYPIKYYEYNHESYGKVENLDSYSVQKEEENLVCSGITFNP